MEHILPYLHKFIFNNQFQISWSVAIKSIRRKQDHLKSPGKHGEQLSHYNEDEVPLLLDEAKTMWSVGVYHENIVNLQGITAEEDCGILCRV